MAQLSVRQFRIGLVIAILLQVATIGLFFFGIIRDDFHPPGTMIFHHGGDQFEYFELARSLIDGQPIRSKYTLGFPLLLIPWTAALKPPTATDLMPMVASFHALILFPLAQILMAGLALRLLRHRTAALLAVLLWTLLAVLLYLVMALIGRGTLGAVWAVHLPWLQMLSDPPAAFLTILSFWLLFRCLDSGQGDTLPRYRGRVWSVLLGLVCGFLLLIRVNGVLSVIAVGAVLIAARRWGDLLRAAVISAAVFIPQLVYNAAMYGRPFDFGYGLDPVPPHGLFSLSYLAPPLTGRYAPLLAIGIIIGLVIVAAGLLALWRRDHYGALGVAIWIVAYDAFFSVYYYSWQGGMTRFLIPVYPAMAILVAALPLIRAKAA